MIYKKRLLLSTLSVAIACSITSQAMAADNEIIVTATSKQSAYAASSHNVASWNISSSKLEQANVTNSQDLYKVLPGLFIGDSVSFVLPATSIRGISTMDYYNSALTLYIDGVPQPSVAFMQPLGDVARVEMLKGPQSTLYGKAAQGGVVNIVTEQPSSEYQGYLSAGYASRNGYRGKFYLSGPLSDGLLYASVSGLRELQNGRLVNPNNGHNHLGDKLDNLGAVRLRLAPENQPWEVNAAYSAQCTDGRPGVFIPFVDLNSSEAIIYPGGPDSDFHRCVRNESIRAQYDGGSWLLTAYSSWQQLKDVDMFPAADRPNLAGRDPSKRVIAGPRITIDKWLTDIQEIRLASKGAGHIIDGVGGLYRENTRQLGIEPAFTIKNQSLAAYTDLTWHVTSAFDFGGGLRFAHDTANLDKPAGIDLWGRPAAPFYNDTSKNHLSGQVSAGWQITEANRIYARIAQGYKAGGFDRGQRVGTLYEPYTPEKSISYEIGNKYHSDQLDVQAAVFYSRTTDMQAYTGIIPFKVLENIGDSTATGVELSGDYVFVPGWKISANVNFVNSKFTDSAKNGPRANKKVPYVANFTGALYLTGNINTAVGMFSPYIGVNFNSGYDFLDTTRTVRQPAWSTTDIRLAWQATDRINVSAYVNNVFDKRYSTYTFDYGPGYPALSTVNYGRTAGVDVKIDLF